MMQYGVMDTGWGCFFAEHEYGDGYFSAHPGYDLHYSIDDALSVVAAAVKKYLGCGFYYLLDQDNMIIIAAITTAYVYRLSGYIGPYDSPLIAYGIAEINRVDKQPRIGTDGIERKIKGDTMIFEWYRNYGDEYKDERYYCCLRTIGQYGIPIIARMKTKAFVPNAGQRINMNITGQLSLIRVFHAPEKLEREIMMPAQAVISYGALMSSSYKEPSNTLLITGRITMIYEIGVDSSGIIRSYVDVESLESNFYLYVETKEKIEINDFIYGEVDAEIYSMKQ